MGVLSGGAPMSNGPCRQRLEQRDRALARVGLDAERNRIVAADVTALDVDLDDLRLRLDRAVVEVAGEVPEPRTEHEQDVRAPARGGGFRRAGATERTDIERMRVRHGIVAPVRGDDREAELLGEPDHHLRGIGARDAAADEHQRTLRLAEQAGGFTDGVRVRQL